SANGCVVKIRRWTVLCSGFVLYASPLIAQGQNAPGDYWVDSPKSSVSKREPTAEDATSLDEAMSEGKSVRIGTGSFREHAPEFYTVRRGDTLSTITERFYGTSAEWPKVWSFNPEITNPNWIFPPGKLRLRPTRTGDERKGPERTSRVKRRPREEVVRLRDEGYIDRDALRASGVIVGSPEEH